MDWIWTVDILRDTGCSGVVVKKDPVGEDQFTEDFNVMLLIDNTAKCLYQEFMLIALF